MVKVTILFLLSSIRTRNAQWIQHMCAQIEFDRWVASVMVLSKFPNKKINNYEEKVETL